MTLILIAVAATAFNLVCTGTAYHSDGILGAPQNVHPFEFEYRVDLSTQRYCRGACTTTAEISSITDTKIIFEAEEKGPPEVIVYANRENGKYFSRKRLFAGATIDDIKIDLAEGTCRREPFTGFPVRKF
jgi:hypothetical protein